MDWLKSIPATGLGTPTNFAPAPGGAMIMVHLILNETDWE
jgi:hypothetical protein